MKWILSATAYSYFGQLDLVSTPIWPAPLAADIVEPPLLRTWNEDTSVFITSQQLVQAHFLYVYSARSEDISIIRTVLVPRQFGIEGFHCIELQIAPGHVDVDKEAILLSKLH